MHFALPPRKTSRPPPYVAARQQKPSYFKRVRLRTVAGIGAGVLILMFLILRPTTRIQSSGVAQLSGPRCIIVTALDPSVSPELEEILRNNRKDYAALHGYDVFFANTSDYDLVNPVRSPLTWARIPAMRHAMTVFPHATYFFYLDQHALIMNPSLNIDDHIVDPRRLETLMIADQPIVPPTSLIKTFRHRRGEHIDLILTQDTEGLSQGSWIVKRGEWAKFFLDSWFDPLYRTYNFQRAERHALEHLVQWHVTVLARLALVPQKVMNSYTKGTAEELYSDGDYVAHMYRCDTLPRVNAKDLCLDEAKPLYEMFQRELRSLQQTRVGSR